MRRYTFHETILFFSSKLNQLLPDCQYGKIELSVGEIPIFLCQEKEAGFIIQIDLDLCAQPLTADHVQELATGNFLGIETAGCALAFDPKSCSLTLRSYSSETTTPEENWVRLEQTLAIAHIWWERLAKWDEFIFFKEPKKEEIKNILGVIKA